MVQQFKHFTFDFSKKETKELIKYQNSTRYYKELEQSRQDFIGLYYEIDQILSRSWGVMDRVLPGLLSELYELLKRSLEIIKNKNQITDFWPKGWEVHHQYREVEQDKIKAKIFVLNYIVEQFRKDFLRDSSNLSEHFSRRSITSAITKSKIRFLNIFNKFHYNSIESCRKGANKEFRKKILSIFNSLELPLVTYPEAIAYDFSKVLGKNKERFLKLLNDKYSQLPEEPIWADKDSGIIFYSINHTEDPMILISNKGEESLREHFKKASEELSFLRWFNSETVRNEIITYRFDRIFRKALFNDLTDKLIAECEDAIDAELEEVNRLYGITYNKHLAKMVFHLNKKENEDQPHKLEILNKVFPFDEEARKFWFETPRDPLEEILVIDLETTGLDIFTDSIIEIGICKLNLKDGHIEEIYNKVCHEKGREINPNSWIFDNSDLSYSDVAYRSPTLKELRKELQQLFHSFPTTSYNQEFDIKFLKNKGFRFYELFWDPMIKSRDILKIPHDYYGIKLPSVQESWEYFFPDQEYKIAHRALDDAVHEAKIIYEILKKEEN
ncbi:MAG: exonuclease domain-containing protein [Nanoarchaeota archaeon]|nr:exonuclease domain-containing protein [Nanoarchaeota archaeon]